MLAAMSPLHRSSTFVVIRLKTIFRALDLDNRPQLACIYGPLLDIGCRL